MEFKCMEVELEVCGRKDVAGCVKHMAVRCNHIEHCWPNEVG